MGNVGRIRTSDIQESGIVSTKDESFFVRPLFVYSMVILLGALCIASAEYHPSGGRLALLYELFSDMLSRKFMKGFGEALIIAGIVGMTIDHYNLRRHRLSIEDMEVRFSRMAGNITATVANDVSANGIMSVYKTVLSDAILGAISKDVLKAELTRKNYNIELVLRRKDGRVKVVQTTDSEVCNQTLKSLVYPFVFMFDKTFNNMPVDGREINRFSVNGKAYSREQISEMSKTADSGNSMVCTDIKLDAKKSVRIVFETCELREEYDTIFWSTLLPTDQMRLTITVPDEDIDVVVETLHPEGPDEDPGSTMARRWVLNGAALPGQGFLVKWRVRQDVVH